MAEALPGKDAPLRASLVAAHMMGIAVLRYAARLEPLASAPRDQVVRLVGPRIQSYLTGSRPRG